MCVCFRVYNSVSVYNTHDMMLMQVLKICLDSLGEFQRKYRSTILVLCVNSVRVCVVLCVADALDEYYKDAATGRIAPPCCVLYIVSVYDTHTHTYYTYYTCTHTHTPHRLLLPTVASRALSFRSSSRSAYHHTHSQTHLFIAGVHICKLMYIYTYSVLYVCYMYCTCVCGVRWSLLHCLTE